MHSGRVTDAPVHKNVTITRNAVPSTAVLFTLSRVCATIDRSKNEEKPVGKTQFFDRLMKRSTA